jgi:hypothetical protein
MHEIPGSLPLFEVLTPKKSRDTTGAPVAAGNTCPG